MSIQVLGVDLRDSSASRGVVVDGAGTVLRSANPVTGAILDGFTLTGAGAAIEQGTGGVSVEFDGDLRAAGPPHMCSPGVAAVMAEAWIGAAVGVRDAVCLVIDDHVTAGILLGGTPFYGAHGRAGSAAWLAINPVDRQDYRKFGSLGAEVTGKGIGRRLSWRVQAGDESAALALAGDLEAITATHVFQSARAGDGVAISVVRDTAKYIGMGIANLALAVDPEVVVLAGYVGASDMLIDSIRQECARRLPPGMAEQVRVVVSTLGGDGVAIGAARMAMLERA
jgi:glucokinase